MASLEMKNIKNNANKKLEKFVKFELYGKELLEKQVSVSGSSGRIYLPPNWIGCNVKIIRVD